MNANYRNDEHEEIGDGWVLTCRSGDNGPLRLSDVTLCRDNRVCQVIGSENLFTPVLVSDDRMPSSCYLDANYNGNDLVYSVLDDIRDLLVNAQKFGSWICTDITCIHHLHSMAFHLQMHQVAQSIP